jgi:hypothetical protein
MKWVPGKEAVVFRVLPRTAGVPTFFSTKFIISWSKLLLFFIFHNFMVKINTFLLSGGRADQQGRQNIGYCQL